MTNIFRGRKKYLTIPIVALLGLIFLPLTIIALVAWFTKRKISNSKVQKVLYAVLGITALPFLASYIIAFTSPASPTTSLPTADSVMQTITPQQTPIPTEAPSAGPITVVTATPESVMSTTIAKPTVKPTILTTSTPHSTVKPTITPTQTPAPAGGGGYSCDCSRTCTEISSCAEAQYQLNTCGCSVRDNDHDGIACDGAPLHCQN